ncbi:hypothetical protein ZRA01_33690 [Zoogloea ramigera]|jgi:uncharacterized protein (DUF1778 family)|uniref:DUF1778 domain-containing protein n=1 Tax=Zoogloea ramigera TaxID=350 RepID=A0A4Y4CYA3_ZOORA|nr:DUF1778 domain-containing protein [Zoogloea ramigera]MCK6388241.1 DUF1778 domain-containing protein [Zoogloea sp.]GEC97296.1 hypothetical protein ZRA01_33690 [Zoogloea ramigera]
MPNPKVRETTPEARGRITARVPQSLVETLDLAASMVGSTVSQFVAQAALEKAERIIENERVIRMSAQTAAWFFDLIDNPPPPTPTLANAIKRYNARKVSSEGSNSTFEFGA